MTKQLIFLFIIPLFTLGQAAKIQTKTDLSQIYIQAITDFVKAAHKKINRTSIHCFLESILTENQATFQI